MEVPEMVDELIVCDPAILCGKPIVKGTRISVALILQCLASGMTVQDVMKGYPTLSREGVRAAIAFAARQLQGEEVHVLQEA
jgi:uncharacterized protein (DUF433 family)